MGVSIPRTGRCDGSGGHSHRQAALEGARIGSYWPVKGEVDLVGFVWGALRTATAAALPVVVKRQPLELWRRTPTTELRGGAESFPEFTGPGLSTNIGWLGLQHIREFGARATSPPARRLRRRWPDS